MSPRVEDKFFDEYHLIKQGLSYLKKNDPVIKRISGELPPLKHRFREPNFEGMARIIINQQLSGAAATTIFDRVKALLPVGRFKPKEFLKIDKKRYFSCGLSKAKTGYIIELAKRFESEPEIIADLVELDAISLQSKLKTFRGFGPWSAAIFSIFYMQHPNVFAHGDVSVLRAICALYGKDIVEDARRLNDHIEKWSPFNSIACMMMWNWVDNQIKN